VFKIVCYFCPIVTSFGMRTALFWAVTQRVVVILYTDFLGPPFGPIFKGQRISHLLGGASLKPHRIGIFRKITISVSNIDFHANSSGCFMRTCGRTDRNDGVDGRFLQLLCERAYKLFSISQRRCFSITKVSYLMLVWQVYFFLILGTLTYILLSE
jgi:hypothetical protein